MDNITMIKLKVVDSVSILSLSPFEYRFLQ